MYHKMNFKCQNLTSYDTGVTHFIGHNVICETISVTFEKRKIHVIGFISNQTISITLVGKSGFELVHLCKGLLFAPFVQMAEYFINVLATEMP